MKMDNAELVNIIEDFINRADNQSGSTLTQNRLQATDYYLGRLDGREPADAALSAQVSGDVADMIDAIMAEISVNLLGGVQLCQIQPDGPDDDMGARIESAVTNKVILDQNRGYEILSNAVQAALLYKTGIVAVEAVETDQDRTRFVGQVEPEQRAMMEGETGGVVDDDGALTWTETHKRVELRCVAPENFYVDREYPGWSLKTSNFCAERIFYTRGALMEMGHSWGIVKDLQVRSVLNTSTDISNRYASRAEDQRAQATPEQDIVECFICYINLPAAGHKLRLHKVLLADRNVILSSEPVDFIPYAVGKVIPVIGRFHGVSLFDRLKPVEDGKTAAYRQLEDNLAYSNNAELILGATANIDDANNRVPGGYVRADVPTDVIPMQPVDLTSASLAYLAQMDKLRSERGGSAMDMQEADSQLMRGATQAGAAATGMVLTSVEARSAFYARNLSETLLRDVFTLTHQSLRRYEMDPIGVWVANQFVMVSPAQFRERESINVRTGMSSGERAKKLAAIDAAIMMQTQIPQLVGPGVLSDPSTLYTLLIERDKVAGLHGNHWIDPRSPQSLQAQQANAQSSQQQQQLATQLEEAKLQLEAQQQQLDKYKIDKELEWKYYDTNMDAEVQEAKMVSDNVTKLTLGAKDADEGQDRKAGADAA